MFDKRKIPAPEPYAIGALWLLQRVALFMRNEADSISTQQLSDLGDAIHNVPDSLIKYGDFFDEQKIRDWDLARYDEKWATGPHDFSLISVLDQGIECAKQWLAESDGRRA